MYVKSDITDDSFVSVDARQRLAETAALIDVYRPRLGSFASDRDSVAAEYVLAFGEFNNLSGSDILYYEAVSTDSPDVLVYEHAKKVYRVISSHFADKMVGHLNNIIAEAWLWNCVINDISFESIRPGTVTNSYVERFAVLEKVYNNPINLPFYEAGIWDETLIHHCIANGVDSSLALSLDEVVNK